VLATQRKRKASEISTDECEGDLWPNWVVCQYTWKLFKAGEKPAPEVQLSPKAAAQVARLKAWAEQKVEQEERDMQARREALFQPLPSFAERMQEAQAKRVAQRRSPPPQPQQPSPLPPMHAVANPPQFDPAVLARVAAIKTGARDSPVCVMGLDQSR